MTRSGGAPLHSPSELRGPVDPGGIRIGPFGTRGHHAVSPLARGSRPQDMLLQPLTIYLFRGCPHYVSSVIVSSFWCSALVSLLGVKRGPLGCFLGSLGGTWGRSWVALGSSWGALGSPWVALGVLLGPLGSLLGRSWLLLCRSWLLSGRSWADLGLVKGAKREAFWEPKWD